MIERYDPLSDPERLAKECIGEAIFKIAAPI